MTTRFIIFLLAVSAPLLWGCDPGESTINNANETSISGEGGSVEVAAEDNETDTDSSEADFTETETTDAEPTESAGEQAEDEESNPSPADSSDASTETDTNENGATGGEETDNEPTTDDNAENSEPAPDVDDEDESSTSVDDDETTTQDDATGDTEPSDTESNDGDDTGVGADGAGNGSATGDAEDGGPNGSSDESEENASETEVPGDADGAGDGDSAETGDAQPNETGDGNATDTDNADNTTPGTNGDSPSPPGDNGDETPIDENGSGETDNEATSSRGVYPEGPYFPASEVVSDLTFELGDGAPFNLANVRRNEDAKVLVLYSGVAWCGSCRYHMIQYGAMLDRLSSRGLAVVSVVREAYDGSVAQGAFVAAYARNNSLTYDVVADPNGALNPFIDKVQETQPGAFRIAMVIDLDTMTLLHIGQISPASVEQLITPLLDAP